MLFGYSKEELEIVAAIRGIVGEDIDGDECLEVWEEMIV